MTHQKLAAGFIALTVIVIAAIAIPHDKFDPPLLLSIGIFVAACALPVWRPSVLMGASSTNSANIASIGLSGVNFFVFFLLSLLALLAGIFLESRSIVYIACVASFGWLFSTSLLTRRAISLIDQIAEQPAVGVSRAEIQIELSRVATGANQALKSDLRQLSEEIRYSPNDTKDAVPENFDVMNLIKGDLYGAVRSNDADKAQEVIELLNALLSQRNSRLKAIRSKA